jgi:hypothetical protein
MYVDIRQCEVPNYVTRNLSRSENCRRRLSLPCERGQTVCSVYLLGAGLPPNVAQTITIGEGYICFYQLVAATRILSTRQNIGTQGQNNLGL